MPIKFSINEIINKPQPQNEKITNKKSEITFRGNTKLTPSGEISRANAQILEYPQAQRVNIVSFKGLGSVADVAAGSGKAACRGMWMHIAQLPAERSCIGQFLDPQTNKFIKFLHRSRQTHWIMNPLTPLSSDLSPYNSSSRFDRNKYLINLNALIKQEFGSLLKPNELPDDINTGGFTLKMLQQQKDSRFARAFERFKTLDAGHPLKKEFDTYCADNKNWIDNNAVYEGLLSFVQKANVDGVHSDWRSWPKELMTFPEMTAGKSLSEKIEILKSLKIEDNRFAGRTIDQEDMDKITQFQFEQFMFNKQFQKQKEILDAHGIKLFVDLAYSVSHSGKDVWGNKSIVELDATFNPRRYTGCMPDGSGAETQNWGNAVWNYDSPEFWAYQEASIKQMLKEGCVRIDHFGGLINRGVIPANVTNNGRNYSIFEALKPQNEGGLGKGYWQNNWLEDVSKKTNQKGETLIDMYLRVAKEAGLKSEETFIVEDLGGVCDTPVFKEFMNKYGDKLSGLRLPYTYGIGNSLGKKEQYLGGVHNPYSFKNAQVTKNIALLSGSHDPESLTEIVEMLVNDSPQQWGTKANSSFYLREFLKTELKIKPEDIKTDPESVKKISEHLLTWLYQRPAKHVQTTIADALGLFFRQNIPGDWNGSDSRHLMKPGTTPLWSRQFPNDFLDRIDRNGTNPGYKDRADRFTQLMERLFGKASKPAIELDTTPIVISNEIAKDESFVAANMAKVSKESENKSSNNKVLIYSLAGIAAAIITYLGLKPKNSTTNNEQKQPDSRPIQPNYYAITQAHNKKIIG